ncbi:MAG: VOC family protein, partial [Gemmatimonadota bacterium]|nr:VOC family protein [Gemmatimonadota bacterium]
MDEQSNPPGSFCWVELGSSNAAAARAFYTDLFGWSVTETPMGEAHPYLRFGLRSLDVAALYQVDPGQPNATPDFWGTYVSVDDVDAAVARAAELEGTVVVPPFDVMTSGRMAVLADPQGARFSLWQAGDHCGVMVRDEPGSLCWNELLTSDPGKAQEFYCELFGWEAMTADMPIGPYTSFFRAGTPVGGMVKLQAGWGDVPPHWVVYFAVADCDEAVQRGTERG